MLAPRYHTDYRYGRYTLRGIRPNSEYWMTSNAGSWKFVTNKNGFRNTKNFGHEKPVSTIRVLSLGDSHTQGYEVRQEFTFSAVLERFLNHNAGKAEVINAGVSGFSTAEELVFLENEGVKYNPDVVVLGFFANDFEDNIKAGLFELDDQNRLIERKYEHIPGVRIQNAIYSIPGVPWLSENSYFYSLLFNNLWNFFKERLWASAARQAGVIDASPTTATAGLEYAVPTEAVLSARHLPLRRNSSCACTGSARGVEYASLWLTFQCIPDPFATNLPCHQRCLRSWRPQASSTSEVSRWFKSLTG